MTRVRLDLAGAHTTGLYSELLGEGLSASTIDSGYRSIDYSGLRTGRRMTRFDHVIQSPELFQAGLTRLDWARFNPLYQHYAGEALPWMILDESTLQGFDQEITRWHSAHPEETGATEALARHIYDWVLDPSGLGIRTEVDLPELSADDAIHQRRADCSEFVKIFLTLFNRVGFSPFPVWVGRDLRGDSVQHFATGIEIAGSTFLIDPVYRTFNASHPSYTRIGLREFLAWHWNNVALDRRESNPSGALAAFERALEIDPRNPHIFLNRGIFYSRQGDTAGARADFERALTIDRRFHPAYYELGNLDFDAGRYSEATRNYRMAVRLAPHEADYQTNLSLALSHVGSGSTRSGTHLINPCE